MKKYRLKSKSTGLYLCQPTPGNYQWSHDSFAAYEFEETLAVGINGALGIELVMEEVE